MVGTFLRRFLTSLQSPQIELTLLHLEMARPLTEMFPEVPPPDSPLTLILLAARWLSHDLHGEEMPRIAADLLEAGFDTPALVRLAGETEIHSTADAKPLVTQVFRELGIPDTFSETHAKLIATRQIAREVIAGTRDPYRAARHLEFILWSRKPATDDLVRLFDIRDEFKWDAEERRSLPALLADQLQTFARLATLTDEQIASES
ncbi:hypothetical protein [Acidicapsa ligni]|uniref:hypothetical protein n=1 Tax=Acidicapsa ligni TaxID=542300 RepID=UPI0021E01FB9|nr:hypothetical protein [Acidicapsa ligni]